MASFIVGYDMVFNDSYGFLLMNDISLHLRSFAAVDDARVNPGMSFRLATIRRTMKWERHVDDSAASCGCAFVNSHWGVSQKVGMRQFPTR